MKKNKSAFTLIELLVVIAIIGLLATLSVIALNNARAKGRDAQRIANVKQIQTALEMYYNDMQVYPPDTIVTTTNTLGIYSTTTGATTTYMQKLPIPPTPPTEHTAYTYLQTDTGASYTLKYYLEGNIGAITSGLHTAWSGAMY